MSNQRGNMIIRMDMNITNWIYWTKIAIEHGFQREQPKFAWSEKEKKEAVRFVMQ